MVTQLTDRLRAAAEASPPLADLLKEAADVVQENEAWISLHWNARARAIKRWQAAHPGNEGNWPDHADLMVWLMEQLEAR
jgi:hypothetical protein